MTTEPASAPAAVGSALADAYDFLGRVLVIAAGDETSHTAVRQLFAGFAPTPAGALAPSSDFRIFRTDDGWQVNGARRTLQSPTDFSTALAHLETHVIFEALAPLADHFHVHGAAVCLPTQRAGLILAGKSGAGKSTLTLGLMLRGFVPFTDDVALIDPANLEMSPFPRAFHVEDDIWRLLEPINGGPISPGPGALPGYFSPPQWAQRPVPVKWMLFPQYAAGQKPELLQLKPSDAVAEIIAQASGLHRTPRLGLSAAVKIAESVPCYRFASGDLAESVAVVQQLVQS